MIIEYGKKQQQKMIFVNDSMEAALTNFKQQCIKAYEDASFLHKNFYRELERYQNDKQTMLRRIMCLTVAYETILLDLCAGCESVNLIEMGKLSIKMHLQSMEIIKWLIKNLGEFSAKSIENSEKYLHIYEQLAKHEEEKKQKHKPNYYYRVKENSLFIAEGIGKEILKMAQQIKNQQKMKENQFKRIKTTKQKIDKIQPSETEQILFEAAEVIAYHSEAFKKLAKENKQNFLENFKDLNVKPYSKIKNEFDQELKSKIEKAMEKLTLTLNRFIDHKSLKIEQQYKKQHQGVSYGIQTNLIKELDEKYIKEEKKKTQKLRQALANMNFHKNRADRLEELLRQKSNYEEKMMKARYDRSKKSQKDASKKSVKELTSLHKINDNPVQNVSKSKKIVDFHARSNSGSPTKRTRPVISKQSVMPHKSLSKIQFNVENDSMESSQSQSQKQSIQCQPNLQICSQEVNIQFYLKQQNPQKVVCKCNISQILEKDKDRRKNMLNMCLNVLSVDFKSKIDVPDNKKFINRNKSLLTITNIRNTNPAKRSERESQRKSAMIFKPGLLAELQNIQPLGPLQKFLPINRRMKKQRSQQFFLVNQFEDENSNENGPQNNEKLIQINKVAPNQQNTQNNKIDEAESSLSSKIMEEKQNSEVMLPKNPPTHQKQRKPAIKINNNFEILNIDQEPTVRNKKRLNAMMTELKKKRLYKEGLPGQRKKNHDSNSKSHSFEPAMLLDLYFKEENAMEAEIQYGVAVSNLVVGSRKIIKDSIDPKFLSNIRNEQYIEQMSKTLQKAFTIKRQKQPKLYKQVHGIIKFPLSFIKGGKIEKQKIKQQLNMNDIKNFVRFITNLHEFCQDKPCQHVKDFLSKINIKIN